MVLLMLAAAACSDDKDTSSQSTQSGGTESGSTTAGTATTDAPGTTAADILGEKNPATGEPVRIGFISDGSSDFADSTIEGKVAKALESYLNDYKGGIGGRPIELVTCETDVDPAKTTDCANQLIQENVVAVVAGQLAFLDNAWNPIHDAHIPYFGFAGSSLGILTDTESSFFMVDLLAGLLDIPVAAAQEKGVDKVTAVLIDLPTLTVFFDTVGKGMYSDAGFALDTVAIPADQADMTPQMQQLASGDPGLVFVMGSPNFCTAAFNGLRAVGFTGPVAAISDCFTDATYEAVPAEFLKGMTVYANSPIGDNTDADVQLYNAILDAYAPDADRTDAGGYSTFTDLVGFVNGLAGITGDITPASIIATLKSMDEMPVPLGGGITYRCNGKAVSLAPAICARGGLFTVLGDDGKPTTYTPAGSTPIEG